MNYDVVVLRRRPLVMCKELILEFWIELAVVHKEGTCHTHLVRSNIVTKNSNKVLSTVALDNGGKKGGTYT